MAAGAPPVVLVVDDDPDLRMMFSLLLRSRGFEVVPAADGPEALRELEGHQQIDAVLLDERMPAMTGSETLVQLRGIPHRVGLPVISISAFGADVHVQQQPEYRADAFLPKPFAIGDLVSTLNQLLADSSTHHRP